MWKCMPEKLYVSLRTERRGEDREKTTFVAISVRRSGGMGWWDEMRLVRWIGFWERV